MAIHLVLTGAYAGRTIVLNKNRFENGRLRLDQLSGNESLIKYYATFNAYLEGSEELAAAQYRDQIHAGHRPEGPFVRQSDSLHGAHGQSTEGQRSHEGSNGFAVGNDPLVSGANGDSSAAVGPTSEQSFYDAKSAKLANVLKSLDPAVDDHWTQAGLPAIIAVEQAYGSTGITRKDLETVLPGWNRDRAGREAIGLQ